MTRRSAASSRTNRSLACWNTSGASAIGTAESMLIRSGDALSVGKLTSVSRSSPMPARPLWRLTLGSGAGQEITKLYHVPHRCFAAQDRHRAASDLGLALLAQPGFE